MPLWPVLETMVSPVGGVDCTVSVYPAFAVYSATAVTAPSIVNVTDFWPGLCAAPFTVHCEKVYPVGSVAGAWRFTFVPLPTPAFV